MSAKNMDEAESWLTYLRDHPIFSDPLVDSQLGLDAGNTELLTGAQRRICMRDTDIIVAIGREVRMMPMLQVKGMPQGKHNYRRLALPNISFPIHQLALNSNKKLLAICGRHEVAVVALPKTGYAKAVGEIVDCRCVPIGPYYHREGSTPPIAKIDWHPWGDSGSTLHVLTVDGALREYDITSNPEIPQQVYHLLGDGKKRSFNASKDAATSFTVGAGTADWGPLTLYVLTAGGSIYAMCPFLPKNSQVPLSYLNSLQGYLNGKQIHLASNSASLDTTAQMEQQRQFVKHLMKPASSRKLNFNDPEHGLQKVEVRDHRFIQSVPEIQGPFLLQPSPHEVDSMCSSDAADILYTGREAECGTEEVALNIVVVAFQDGKVDVCLDLHKVEARWKPTSFPLSDGKLQEPPVLIVYESIDLGRSRSSPSMEESYPVLVCDTATSDVIYIYHRDAIYCVSFRDWLSGMRLSSNATQDILPFQNIGIPSQIKELYSVPAQSQRSGSEQIVGMLVGDGSTVPRGLLAFTSTFQVLPFLIENRPSISSIAADTAASSRASLSESVGTRKSSQIFRPVGDAKIEVSLLSIEPWQPPMARIPHILVDANSSGQSEMETVRLLQQTSEIIRPHIQGLISDAQALLARIEVQEREQQLQLVTEQKVMSTCHTLQDRKSSQTGRLAEAIQRKTASQLRTEKLKSKLLHHSSPRLSASEATWFEEVNRINSKLHGAQQWDEEAVQNRIHTLESQLHALENSAHDISTDTKRSKFEYSPPRPKAWGTDQIYRYIGRLQYLQDELQGLQNKVQNLSRFLAD